MTFLAPNRLWLLVGVAAVVGAYAVLQQRRRHYAVRFTNVDLLSSLAPRRPGWRRHVAAGCLIAALAAMTVAFSRPTRVVRVPRSEATVMLAIDTSGSMAADDVTPSRLVAAQKSATEFVAKLPLTFRVGLIAFDATARVVVSPTTDHQAVTDGIATLRTGTATAAGDAVFLALDAVAPTTTAAGGGGGNSARIVVMSDGATTTGRPVPDAAAAARAAQVPVSTISFGTPDGTVTIGNRTVAVPVDRSTMQQLAEISGGKAFQASSGNELSSVYRGIANSIGYTKQHREATVTWVGAALVLALLGVGAGLVWGGRIL
jgi:Ca-activated chloride channel family protein